MTTGRINQITILLQSLHTQINAQRTLQFDR